MQTIDKNYVIYAYHTRLSKCRKIMTLLKKIDMHQLQPFHLKYKQQARRDGTTSDALLKRKAIAYRQHAGTLSDAMAIHFAI